MGFKGKLNAGILCGGKSAEHEVSLQSAKNVYEAMDREKFNPILIGIDKNGRWLYRPHSGVKDFLDHDDDPKRICIKSGSCEVALLPKSGGRLVVSHNAVSRNAVSGKAASDAVSGKAGGADSIQLDVIFPILHGPFGEDGTVQGLLKLAELPFVGSGVVGSAAGMDKDVMKRLFRDGGIPIGKFLVLREGEKVPRFTGVAGQLGNPVFVKPANMGSSVGVNKVRNEKEFRAAVEEAFRYDTKLVLEETIPGREIECSVLGNEDPEASVPGEVRAAGEFYSYKAKYIDSAGAALEIPAPIPGAAAEEIRALAVKAFRILECQGLSRVDFFLKEDGSVVVNEINTMPGFTSISMYPKLWEASGIGYTELITRLIDLALARFEKDKRLRHFQNMQF